VRRFDESVALLETADEPLHLDDIRGFDQVAASSNPSSPAPRIPLPRIGEVVGHATAAHRSERVDGRWVSG
jgi:hypothetical protein